MLPFPHDLTHVALFGGSRTLGGVEIFNARLTGLAEAQGAKIRSARLNSHLAGRNRLLAWLNFVYSFMMGVLYLWVGRPQTVVVSAANFLDVLAAWGFSRLTGRRDIVLIAHFNASWNFWRSPCLVRLFQQASYRIHVFCIAPNQKIYFLNRGIHVEEVIFPNFINYRVQATRAAPSQYAPGPILKALFVGRVVPEKRVSALSAFLARVAHQSMPIELAIVGACSPEQEQDILRHQTPHFRVVLHGTKSEAGVSLALQKAMLFCSFSASDTLPLNMLEAAAHDVPILTLRNPVTEDVRDLVGDILFVEETESAQTVRDKIHTTLHSLETRKPSYFFLRNDEIACRLLGINN